MPAIKKSGHTKSQYLSLVIKRGDQQREESEKRLTYEPIDWQSESEVEENSIKYRKIFKKFGWDVPTADAEDRNEWISLSRADRMVGETPESSQVLMRSATVKENDHSLEMQRIDYSRHRTHRIWQVPDRIQNHFLKRNCDFRYRIDKKSGEKTYHRKDLSFKVEAFDRINADSSLGVKKGHKDLNLASYIGRGLVTECLQLDKNEQIFMTVRIAVSPISAINKDITTLSLLAT